MNKSWEQIAQEQSTTLLIQQGIINELETRLENTRKKTEEIFNEPLENKWDEWTQGRKDAAGEIFGVVTRKRIASDIEEG